MKVIKPLVFINFRKLNLKYRGGALVQLLVEYMAAWEAIHCSLSAAIDWLVIRRLYKL